MTISKLNWKIEEDYFDWLYGQIEESSGMETFLHDLHSFPFICHVPNDDNRVEDGLALRRKYADEQGIDFPEDKSEEPCTILEMLIALTYRLDFIMFDPAKGNRFRNWFWMFIDNLKLQKYTNADSNIIPRKRYNRVVIRKFVNREYLSDGRGGLFPLDDPTRDQRTIEIWYQMMSYIRENYEV